MEVYYASSFTHALHVVFDENAGSLLLFFGVLVTLFYNNRGQRNLLRDNARVQTNEAITKSVQEIQKKLNDLQFTTEAALQKSAADADSAHNASTPAQQQQAINERFDQLRSLIDDSWSARREVASLLDTLETEVFSSESTTTAIKALKLRYQELTQEMDSMISRLTLFDRQHVTIPQFNLFIADIRRTTGKIAAFNLSLEDLVVIIHNSLVAPIFGKRRVPRTPDSREVLEESGFVDHRITTEATSPKRTSAAPKKKKRS